MKRVVPLLVVAAVAVAGGALLRDNLFARPCSPPAAAPEACCPAKAGQSAKLVAILDEARSRDTFLLTVLALSQFEDRAAAPAVIRNADRLGLTRGIVGANGPAGSNPAQEIVVGYLTGQLKGEGGGIAQRYSCGAPACSYSPPAPTLVPAGVPVGAMPQAVPAYNPPPGLVAPPGQAHLSPAN
jgi:hypothetical protein